jgi:glycosyltransferase involved in cell wall biosynthesis
LSQHVIASPLESTEGGLTTDISVVVVTYNRDGMLRNALKTLVNQITENKFSFDILVIDDGSTDNTSQVVQSFAKNSARSVRYIYKENGGEGDARNKGVAEARGRWIAFFDDDQLAEPGWLTELYRVAQETRADCVDGPVLLMLPDPSPLQLGRKSRRVLAEKIFVHSNRQHSGKYVGTGNVLIRKSIFEKVGLFDITFRQGVDEDFFRRVQKGDFKFWYSPHALVYHVIPSSRLQLPYLRETCLRMAVASTRIRLKYEGALKLALLTTARIGVAIGRDIPLLLFAALLKDAPLILDCRCGLWYSLGLVRGSLSLLAPNVLPQNRFMSSLDLHYAAGFRNGPTEPI